MLDLHAHLLPGIDDGARNELESHQMLKAAQEAGVTHLVATPHMNRQYNDLYAIDWAFQHMRPAAERYGIALYKGAELNIDLAGDIRTVEACSFSLPWRQERFVLLELHNDTHQEQGALQVATLVRHGFCPVLAHPERYDFVQADVRSVLELRAYGSLLQVDACALTKKWWDRERKAAANLLKAGWIDCLASDAHVSEEYAAFSRILQDVRRKDPKFQNVLER